MHRLASLTLAHPRRTVAAWLLATLALAAGGSLAGGALAPTTLLIPGGGADRAEQLAREHGLAATDVAALVRGRPSPARAAVSEIAAEVRRRGGAASIRRPGRDILLVTAVLPRPDDAATARPDTIVVAAARAAGRRHGAAVDATGPGVAGRALEAEALTAVSRAELIALPALLLVLLLVFRSVAAACTALAFGAAAVIATHGAVGLLAHALALDAFAVTVGSMVGLALGVDYALLAISRFREELSAGAGSPIAAARRTAVTAGRTVALAGIVLTVALGAALALAPGGILLSTAAGALAAAACAAAGALVGLPPLLAVLGPRVNAGALPGRRAAPRRPRPASAGRLRPGLVAAAVAAGLLALAGPAAGLTTGPPDASQLPDGHPDRRATEALAHGGDGGAAAPFAVALVAPAGTDPSALAARSRRELAGVTGVRAAGIDGVRGPAVMLRAVGPAGANDPATRATHARLTAAAQRLRRDTGATVAVGGQAAEFTEFRDEMRERGPRMILAVAVAAGLALAAALRAPVLALVAVVLNLLAVAAAFGAVALLFGGDAPLLGGPGFVDAVSLVAAFTVVFGLSIDYHVFVLARMREERARGSVDVVGRALAHTRPVVAGAAAIMATVFVAFAFAEMAAIRQLGSALAIAVVLDATLVRLVLLPAVCRLLGDRLWWAPVRPVARLSPER